MLPIIQIDFLTIRTPGLALLAGLWFGLDVASRIGARRKLNVDKVFSLGFYAAIAGVLAARLGFVLAHLDVYTKITAWDRLLGSIFALMPGTEIAWVGMIAAAGVGIGLARRWRLPPLVVADSYAVGLAVLGIFIGIAALLGGDMYGVEADLPWSIDLWGTLRHPTQIYFALGCLAITIVLWRLEVRKSGPPAPGMLTQYFLLMMGAMLLLIEPLRADSPVIFGSIRLWQVVGLACVTAALAWFTWRAPAAEAA